MEEIKLKTKHLTGWRQRDIPSWGLKDQDNIWIEDKDKHYKEDREHLHIIDFPESLRDEVIELLKKLDNKQPQKTVNWKTHINKWKAERVVFNFGFKPFKWKFKISSNLFKKDNNKMTRLYIHLGPFALFINT